MNQRRTRINAPSQQCEGDPAEGQNVCPVYGVELGDDVPQIRGLLLVLFPVLEGIEECGFIHLKKRQTEQAYRYENDWGGKRHIYVWGGCYNTK